MKKALRASVCTLTIALGLLVSSTSFADDKSAARSLALEGKKAFDSGEYEKAIEYFERAERQYHASTHQVLMAHAHVALGQLVQALECLYTVVNEVLPPDANDVLKNNKEQALQMVGELEARISKLTINVSPPGAPDLAVVVDERALSTDLLGVPRRTNPGKRVIEVSASGYETARIEVELSEGGTETIDVELTVSAQTEASEAPPKAPEDGGAPKYRVLSYTALGVGLAGIGTGVAFLVMGSSDSGKADELLASDCNISGDPPLCTQATSDRITSLDKSAATKKTVGVVGLSVGAAALATGAVLWVLGRDGGNEVALGPHLKARPWAVPVRGGAGLGLTGRF